MLLSHKKKTAGRLPDGTDWQKKPTAMPKGKNRPTFTMQTFQRSRNRSGPIILYHFDLVFLGKWGGSSGQKGRSLGKDTEL